MSESLIGLPDKRVWLLPHATEWKQLYAVQKERLLTLLAPYLGSIVTDIQHIGSTAIPGIPAKPIIDIGVAVTDFDAARVCIEPLQQAGFVYLGENEVPGRHFFYLGEGPTTGRTHHVHMLEQDSRFWLEMIGFRDYMLEHPAIAAAYGEMKMKLAREFPDDRPGYLAGKAPFILQVLGLVLPDSPLSWTSIHHSDSGVSFAYCQSVVGLPVMIDIGRGGVARRIHLYTEDRRSLYFEVTLYGEPLTINEGRDRLVEGLRDQFQSFELTELHPIDLDTIPAQQFGFTAGAIRREVIFVPGPDRLLRIIFDPFSPMNWAVLESVDIHDPSPEG